MANHGPSYGLSRELERKNLARFNMEEAQEILVWIEQVTDKPFSRHPGTMQTSQDVVEVLKDGIHLCLLFNRLVNSTGHATYNPNPKMPFQKMENISNFLDAIKVYGVPEISCFQTVDLYENKQCYKVIECIRALAAVARSKKCTAPLPPWVVRLSQCQPRNFPANIIKNGQTVIPLQYGTNKCASQKGMTPYGLMRQIKPES